MKFCRKLALTCICSNFKLSMCRKLTENCGKYIYIPRFFSQLFTHCNPHTVKMYLGILCLINCTSDVLVNSQWDVLSCFGGVLDLVHLRFIATTMAAKVPNFLSLFIISFNSLTIVWENSQNMLELTVY